MNKEDLVQHDSVSDTIPDWVPGHAGTLRRQDQEQGDITLAA